MLGERAEGVTGQREYLNELLIGSQCVQAGAREGGVPVLSAKMGRPGGAEALQDAQRADKRVAVTSARGDPCFEAVDALRLGVGHSGKAPEGLDIQIVDDAFGEQQYEGVGFVLLTAGGHVQALESDLVGGVPWLVDRLSQKRSHGGAEVLSCGEQPA